MWTQRGCSGIFCCAGALVECSSPSPEHRYECACASTAASSQQPALLARARALPELPLETWVYEHYVRPPSFELALQRGLSAGDCVEVLHLFSKRTTNDRRTGALWLWPLSGTGVFFRVGRRLLRYAEHFEFNRQFKFNGSEAAGTCTLGNKCRYVAASAVHEARRRGWHAIHFTRHSQDRADAADQRFSARSGEAPRPVAKSELVDLQPPVSFAPGATPASYFADATCTRPCTVVAQRVSALRCEAEALPAAPGARLDSAHR